MITQSTVGVSARTEILIANVPVDYANIRALEIHLAENQHDMVVFEILGIPPRAITDYHGKPVVVKIDTGGNFSHEFHGYVEDVRPSSASGMGTVDNSPFQEAKVVCMGASYNMRGKRSRTWSNHKLTEIARELCRTYGFSLDAIKDASLHPTLLQTNESDWQFLTRYAQFLGYSVNVHGTHMHVYDPYKALSRQSSYHILSTMRRKINNSLNPSPGQILKFEGSFSKRHVDGEYKESTVTVVNEDNRMFDVGSRSLTSPNTDNALFPNRVPEYVDSFEEASRRIGSVAKQKYDYYADAHVLGVAGCVPGGIVNVDNFNSDFDGFWYVQEVKHRVHSQAFTTDLRLARNYNSELQFTNTASAQKPPKSVYGLNRWVAENNRVNIYE